MKQESMKNLNLSTGSLSNLIVSNRNPVDVNDSHYPFWLNFKTKELFHYSKNVWESLTNEYIKLQNHEKLRKKEDTIEKIVPPLSTHLMEKKLKEDIEWLDQVGGINLDLLGEK
jgi:hypothetical protein